MGSSASTQAKDNQANNIGSTGRQTNWNFSDITQASRAGGSSFSGGGSGGAGGDGSVNTGIQIYTSDMGAIEAGSEMIALGMNFVSDAFDDLLASNDKTLSGISGTLSTLTENTKELNRPTDAIDYEKMIKFVVIAGAAIFLIPKAIGAMR